MNIGIVGYGHVGKAMKQLFQDAVVYDKYLLLGDREAVNKTEVAFVCVPTPQKENGECDTQAVEDVISWLESDCIVIRSTVPVGFTAKMKEKYQKRIVFQPEYYGETVAHPFADLKKQNWLSFGGEGEDVDYIIRAYQSVITSDVRINIYPSNAVEMAKYMENCYFAAKVTFCNEMYQIAQAMGVDYNMAREVWLSDPRIGRSHTFVYKDARGFGGSCLPKDLAALIYQAEQYHEEPRLLKAVQKTNEFIRNESEKR